MKLHQLKSIHFVGIGGAGVCGLARMALQAGVKVSGSDKSPSAVTESLAAAGAEVSADHCADNVPADAQLVVITAAVKADNPEVVEARRRGMRVLKYAEALGEFTRGLTNLCVCGTHGKTSTTAMLAQVLRAAGKENGWLVGGEPASLPASSEWGKGRLFAMESCEYDRSFLKLSPSVVILNNIELDHMDVYGDLEGVTRGFQEFVALLPESGTLIYNADDPRCRQVAQGARCRKVSYGTGPYADWKLEDLRADDGFARARISFRGMAMGEMRLSVPGRVYAMNALAAVAAANWAGVAAGRALSALRDYTGVKRRFEILGSVGGVPLVDDYAHHPTAVQQLLEAARAAYAGRRLLAVFQAHQYQRLNTFMTEFQEALALADRVLVARTYAAREQGIVPGEPEDRLVRGLRSRGTDAMAYSDFSSIVNDLSLKASPRDALLFIGAGDVNLIARELLDRRKYISDRLRAIQRTDVVAGAPV